MQKQSHTLRCFFTGIAACVLPFALLPPLCLFGYVQRYLVSGMSAGALKG